METIRRAVGSACNALSTDRLHKSLDVGVLISAVFSKTQLRLGTARELLSIYYPLVKWLKVKQRDSKFGLHPLSQENSYDAEVFPELGILISSIKLEKVFQLHSLIEKLVEKRLFKALTAVGKYSWDTRWVWTHLGLKVPDLQSDFRVSKHTLSLRPVAILLGSSLIGLQSIGEKIIRDIVKGYSSSPVSGVEGWLRPWLKKSWAINRLWQSCA